MQSHGIKESHYLLCIPSLAVAERMELFRSFDFELFTYMPWKKWLFLV
jgi:hypothetical protein